MEKLFYLLDTIYVTTIIKNRYFVVTKSHGEVLLSIGEPRFYKTKGSKYYQLTIPNDFLELANFFVLKERPEELERQITHLLKKNKIKITFLKKAELSFL